jgi:hypothetical protein
VRIGAASAGRWQASSSPAQIAALAMGVWWVANGVGAFLLDPNLATSHVHGRGDLFGLAITANGWHALFHLLPGVVGIAAASRPQRALTYVLVAGAIYVVVGAYGLIAGGGSIGVIAVDTTGDLVHVVEGALTFAAGILTLQQRRVGGPEHPAVTRAEPIALVGGARGADSRSDD